MTNDKLDDEVPIGVVFLLLLIAFVVRACDPNPRDDYSTRIEYP